MCLSNPFFALFSKKSHSFGLDSFMSLAGDGPSISADRFGSETARSMHFQLSGGRISDPSSHSDTTDGRALSARYGTAS